MKETENISETKALKPKIRLDEVTLMRTILALLIVFMHAFTCYQGMWSPPKGYVDIVAYKWIARTSFSFALEAFVFISGYLFAFQLIGLKRTCTFIEMIINKLKRLILPSIIFGILYFILFYPYKGFGNAVYTIINGCGHMWFLPMLFWCFVGGWLIEKVKISDGWKLVFLVCLYLFWPVQLPLQLTAATNYMVFFWGGYVVYKFRVKICNTLTLKHVFLFWLLFAAAFVFLRPLKETLIIGDFTDRLFRLLSFAVRSLFQLVYASLGVMAFYFTTLFITQQRKLKPFTIKLASCCFGIYLFQQFILRGIYYYTDLPVLVGPYWLPWVGFIVAAPASFLLSVILLKTKVGRSMIG